MKPKYKVGTKVVCVANEEESEWDFLIGRHGVVQEPDPDQADRDRILVKFPDADKFSPDGKSSWGLDTYSMIAKELKISTSLSDRIKQLKDA